MVIESPQPLLPIAVVLAASILILVSGKRPNLREFWSIAGSLLTFAAVAAMAPAVWNGQRLVYTLSTIAPGISLNFRVDGLSLIFGIVSSFLWIFASFYNIGYMRSLNEHAQTRYYVCFAVAILGAQGVSYSGSLFSLYLFYEVITLFTYPLVAHHQDEEGYAGGKKYLVYLMGTSKGLLLPAVILTYVMTGTLDFADNIRNGVFASGTDHLWITVTYGLFIFGFAKAAIMPFHNWLPSAMVAPTPVSALLHAVAVVKAGVFCIARVMLSTFGTNILQSTGLGIVTAYFVSFTILAASIIARAATSPAFLSAHCSGLLPISTKVTGTGSPVGPWWVASSETSYVVSREPLFFFSAARADFIVMGEAIASSPFPMSPGTCAVKDGLPASLACLEATITSSAACGKASNLVHSPTTELNAKSLLKKYSPLAVLSKS